MAYHCRMQASLVLTDAFAAFLVAGLLVKFWLSTRQVRHVALHRNAVPTPFAATVSLAAHQKAADYTMAKSRVGLVETAFGSAVLLGWTLLGGLDALNRALVGWLGTRQAMPKALVVVVIAGNAAWTIASIALLFSGWVNPNLPGETVVAMQAIAVGAFAELQYIGLRKSGGAVTA